MIEITLAELHQAQWKIVESKARFKVLVCGRRFGKTLLGIDMLTDRLASGQACAYFAPTYRMAGDVWREMKRRLEPIRQSVKEHEWRLETYTGGVFECWSLANSSGETVRGRTYDFVVVDEAALIPTAEVWQGAIRPLLTDTMGSALFCSTPRGRSWFWQLYQYGQDPMYPDWESWQYPTKANPHINPDEIEEARKLLPERVFHQEYLAEFLSDGGTVFRNIDGVCVGDVKSRDSIYGDVAFGVDWGKDRDFTCISVMTRNGGQQVYLERFNQIGWTLQRDRLKRLADRWKPYVILAEANSVGSVNIEALRELDLPVQAFTTTMKSKPELIDALVIAMEQRQMMLLNDDVLKHELLSYAMTPTAYGWRYGAPAGGHDDTVMATALSWWATQRYGRILIDFA